MTRAVVIGARRARQGVGEFVARFLHEAGAEVAGVVGTRPESAQDAADGLRTRWGIDAQPFDSLPRALEAVGPDVVAICGPHETHRPHLRDVAAAGAHALCEKPMWWGESDDRRAETESLIDDFASRGLFLELITQWPQTLPGFFQLHPELEGEPIERFSMELGPVALGPGAVFDSMPHPISILQSLVGYGRCEAIEVTQISGDPSELILQFQYNGATGTQVEVETRLRACPQPPRPAAYSLNGRRVDRTIRLPEYVLCFETSYEGETRSVELTDPLALHVKSFLDHVDEGQPIDRRALVEGMVALEALHAAVCAQV